MRLTRFSAGGIAVLPAWPERAPDQALAPAGGAEPGFLWCDCTLEDGSAWVAPVRRYTGIDVLDEHVRDAANPQMPSWFDATHEYRMLAFRGLVTEPGGLAVDAPGGQFGTLATGPAAFLLFPGLLVTVRSAESATFARAHERLARGALGRVPACPDEWMLRLLSDTVDRYLALRQPLAERLDRKQRKLLDPRRPYADWVALLEARAMLRRLENLCEEQLDALQEWRDAIQDDGPLEPHLRDDARLRDALLVRGADVAEHVGRVLAHARRLEASLESAVQLHFSATAHRTNQVMRTLTAITAIFLPLNLITGIFGMNFEFIPGLHSPVGFWVAVAAMVALALGLAALFRARRYVEPGASAWPDSRRTQSRKAGAPPAGQQTNSGSS